MGGLHNMPVSHSHISSEVLWTYRSTNINLSHDDLQHLYGCEECLILLGLCQTFQSIEEVKNRQKEGRGLEESYG